LEQRFHNLVIRKTAMALASVKLYRTLVTAKAHMQEEESAVHIAKARVFHKGKAKGQDTTAQAHKTRTRQSK
jgi:hypothetical protein